MTRRDHLHAITSWLNDLNDLTAGHAPLVDAKRKIAALAAALSEEYPAGAFTRQSLVVVAKASTFFPGFGEICKTLSPWWLERRPQPLAITSDQPASVKQREIEREVRESWQGITAEQARAKIRALNGNPMRLTLGHMLASALRKHAPQHLGLLPPEWLADRTEPADVVALRQPRTTALSPDQLATARTEMQKTRAAALGIPAQVRRADADTRAEFIACIQGDSDA